jgi:hypothetical protein
VPNDVPKVQGWKALTASKSERNFKINLEKEKKMKARNLVGTSMMLALMIVASGWALAKDSVNLKLDFAASVHGTQLAAGEYQVSWQTHSPQATVTFKQKKGGVATAEGILAERPARYESNSVVYSTNADGSRNIIEIRFAGSNKVLTFGDSSPTS